MNRRQDLMIFFVGLGFTLILAGLVPVMALAQEATPEPEPEATAAAAPYDLSAPAITPTGNNSYCAVCHSQPLRAVVLADGYTLRLNVTPQMIADSIHGGETPLGCVDCHGTDAFPHSGPTPSSHRQYALDAVNMCVGCHVEEATDLQNGLHEQAILRGETSAAVCSDCHGAHDVLPVEDQPEIVAGVCGDCHTDTLVEWRASPHAEIGPLDCATCHSPHTQRIRAGQTANALCLNCHEETFATSGIWVHDAHITGLTDEGCVDCHMHAQQTAPDAQSAVVSAVSADGSVVQGGGHTMSVFTVACITCHKEDMSVAEATPEPGDAVTVEDAAEPETLLAEAEPVEDSDEGAAEDSDFVELLQGLILGLGFGATGAAIFVSRGNRRVSE